MLPARRAASRPHGHLRRWLGPWAWIAALLPVAVVVAGHLGAFTGLPPADLGVRERRLKAPADTPNCVSSQAGLWPGHPRAASAQIDAIALGAQPTQAFERLAGVLAAMPRTRILERRGDYVRAESRTLVMNFTDDLELWLDGAQGVAHVRSASRLGRSDLGANRQRVQALREAFEQTAP